MNQSIKIGFLISTTLLVSACTYSIDPQITLLKSKYASDEDMTKEAEYQCRARYSMRAIKAKADSIDTEKFNCE
jgi:hypothetical protein